jgi:hypothetical protein
LLTIEWSLTTSSFSGLAGYISFADYEFAALIVVDLALFGFGKSLISFNSFFYLGLMTFSAA